MNRKQSLRGHPIQSCCYAPLLKSHYGMGASTPCRFAAYALKHSENGAPLRGCFRCIYNTLAVNIRNLHLFLLLFIFIFCPLMHNHTTFSQLYHKQLLNLQRFHAKYAQSAKKTELNLRNTARKTLDKNAMLALSPKRSTFVC